MLAKYTALTVCLWASSILTTAAQAQMDCKKRLDYNAVGHCCARPSFNFQAFQQSCGKYMQEGSPRMSPCLYDCLFKSSNVLNGMQLNVENAQKMIQQLLGSNKDFVEVYVKSLQNCTENVDKMINKVRRRPFRAENCSHLPIFLGMCTLENVFAHCPSASWRGSKKCEEAREFIFNCKCDPTGKVCMQM